MILYWLLTGLVVIFFLFTVPIKVLVDSEPKFISKVSWLFFQFRLEATGDGLAVTYYLFGHQIGRKKKKVGSKKTAKKSKQKRKKKRITLALIRDIMVHSSIPKIFRKIGYLLCYLLRSLSIKRLCWDIAINDYFIQGVLHALIVSVPQTKKVAIGSNFKEKNTFFLRVHISIFKLIRAVLLFLITFPYIDSLRLYKKIKLAL